MKKTLTALCLLIFSSTAYAIMNGRSANLELAATTVKIISEGGNEKCTAVIVDPHLLFTAGHCTEGISNQKIKIKITNLTDGSNVHLLHVLKWDTAIGYTNSESKVFSDVQNDFAYILIKEDLLATFSINPSQVPILISSPADLHLALTDTAMNATAYGYGDFDKKLHDGEKKEVVMSLTTLANTSVLSAKSLEETIGICHGDSGGGIFIKGNEGGILLAGIVSGISQGEKCGSAKSAAFYAPIYRHLCWVQTQTKIHFNNSYCPN
ncbi:MAG: trypsin-like serine protease [Pseudobdellovibrio sp.]